MNRSIVLSEHFPWKTTCRYTYTRVSSSNDIQMLAECKSHLCQKKLWNQIQNNKNPSQPNTTHPSPSAFLENVKEQRTILTEGIIFKENVRNFLKYIETFRSVSPNIRSRSAKFICFLPVSDGLIVMKVLLHR